MNARPLTSPRPGLRFVLYPDHEALHITDELQHLELVSARVPAGGEHAPAGPEGWLATCAGEPGFRLVTMSMDGLLVGFAAGTVSAGVIELRHLVLASPVRTHHPELLGVLADVFVDSAEQPWAEVIVPRSLSALGHLLQEGWKPSAPTHVQVAEGDLLLSGASAR